MSAMTRDEVLRIVREAEGRGERADLREANLRWANLSVASGGLLGVDGLPSGSTRLTPGDGIAGSET